MQTNAAAWWFWILKLFDKRWRGVRYGNFITFSSMASALELAVREACTWTVRFLSIFILLRRITSHLKLSPVRTNIRSIFICIHIPYFQATSMQFHFCRNNGRGSLHAKNFFARVVRVSIFTRANQKNIRCQEIRNTHPYSANFHALHTLCSYNYHEFLKLVQPCLARFDGSS